VFATLYKGHRSPERYAAAAAAASLGVVIVVVIERLRFDRQWSRDSAGANDITPLQYADPRAQTDKRSITERYR